MSLLNIFKKRNEPVLGMAGATARDAVAAISSGEGWAADFYSFSGMDRSQAVSYGVLSSCVTLLSSIIARSMTAPGVRVIDEDGRTVKTQAAVVALRTLRNGNGESMIRWWENFASDYLLDGNAVAVPVGAGRWVDGLHRALPGNFTVMPSEDGRWVNPLIQLCLERTQAVSTYRYKDIIHASWPMIQGTAQTGLGSLFAPAPIVLMRPAVSIGRAADAFIAEYLNAGPGGLKSGIAVNFTSDKVLTPAQHKELISTIKKFSKRGSNFPLVTFGETRTGRIDEPLSQSGVIEIRHFQIEEICRIFGVPGSMVNDLRGSKIGKSEQLGRHALRFGIEAHLARIASAVGARLLPRGLMIKPETSWITRGDVDAQAKLLMAGLGDAQRRPVFSITEARRIIEMDQDWPDELKKMIADWEATNNSGSEKDSALDSRGGAVKKPVI